MENKLELKHLAPYLPYGLRIAYGNRRLIREMVADRIYSPQTICILTVLNPKLLAKPLLIPLSEYKIWLPEVLKIVSLYDLTGCRFEIGNDDGIHWCNAVNDRMIDAVQYDGNYFKIMDDDKMKPLSPQYSGFEALAACHVDFYNLIEAGLELNKLEHGK